MSGTQTISDLTKESLAAKRKAELASEKLKVANSALKPFSELADEFTDYAGECLLFGGRFTVDDLRKAAAAIRALKPKGPQG